MLSHGGARTGVWGAGERETEGQTDRGVWSSCWSSFLSFPGDAPVTSRAGADLVMLGLKRHGRDAHGATRQPLWKNTTPYYMKP